MTLEQLQVVLAILLAIGGITYGVCVRLLEIKNKLLIVLAYCGFSVCVIGGFILVNTYLIKPNQAQQDDQAKNTPQEPTPKPPAKKADNNLPFKGKSTYDPKTRQLMIHYDFRTSDQLEDFEVPGDSKPKVKDGFLVLNPYDQVRHRVKYVTLKMNGLINLGQWVGNHFRTTGGYKFDCHPHSGSACYITVDNGAGVGNRITVDPRDANGRLIKTPIAFEVDIQADEISAGLTQLKSVATPKGGRTLAPAGQIELEGGPSGKSYGGITITGIVEEEWARLFLTAN